MGEPKIIQGGMGIGISSWCLAREVSMSGYLGTVSGTCAELVLARNLQLGDPGGHWRRALSHFPIEEIAERVIKRYYIEGGKDREASFASMSMFSVNPPAGLIELTICANFAQIWLAKEGHNGIVAVNLMAKLPIPIIYTIFGCMLANVDYILIGAGIPMDVPATLDTLENMQTTVYPLYVTGANKGDVYKMEFDPKSIAPSIDSLRRPKFVPIITSHILAIMMNKRLPGKIDGWIIEYNDAGGHNAPPRGKMKLDDDGQIIYGPRDEPDLEKIINLGLPTWLAGSFVDSDRIKSALDLGVVGFQYGTIFALSNESELEESSKRGLLEMAYNGNIYVFDDPRASPTGYPFKVAYLSQSLANGYQYDGRPRVCNIGHLRQLFAKDDGSVGYRCPAEPVDIYVSKGGDIKDTVDRKCLCNALAANIGLEQVQHKTKYREKQLVTLGKDSSFARKLMISQADSFSAREVIVYIEALFP